MSKKRDPVIAIVDYFTGAELAQVEVALAIVKEIVRKRRPLHTPAQPTAASGSRSHKKKREVELPLPLDALAPVS